MDVLKLIFADIQAWFDILGSSVVVPIFIFLYAVALGTKVGRAFRSAVIIGVALIGINLVIGLMWGALTGVSQAMVQNAGIERDIFDIGWPAAATIAFASDVGIWVFPIALLVNVVMLALRWTKTLNIDVWNFWHFAFIGSLISVATNNIWLGLISAGLMAALMLFFADWTAPAVQEFYNLPGISIPHGTSSAYVPFAIPLNWLIDQIPGLRDLEADPEAIQKTFGPTFGDPMVLGLLIGLILGIIGFVPVLIDGAFAYDAWKAFIAQVLQLGVNLAAVMILLPRMVQILMEGLIPISEAAREFMQKRGSGREVYIGLDSAILIGHPSVISASLILVPIAIILSIIIPGNHVLLFADLAIFPFVVAIFAPITRGNVVRIVIIGTICIAIGFFFANSLAPVFTSVAAGTDVEIPAGAVQVISVGDGFLPTPWIFVTLASLLRWGGIVILFLLVAALIFFYLRNPEAWEVIAGGPKKEVVEGAGD